ncbi:hypothetical protein APUTEX25_005730, partial [Auxenochlorella protothecoides]
PSARARSVGAGAGDSPRGSLGARGSRSGTVVGGSDDDEAAFALDLDEGEGSVRLPRAVVDEASIAANASALAAAPFDAGQYGFFEGDEAGDLAASLLTELELGDAGGSAPTG